MAGSRSHETVRDEDGTVHAFDTALTLCGQWVDAGRWSSPRWLRGARLGPVDCELCRRVLSHEQRDTPGP